jgi:hypothetical protein
MNQPCSLTHKGVAKLRPEQVHDEVEVEEDALRSQKMCRQGVDEHTQMSQNYK